jgi:hypothetical protein
MHLIGFRRLNRFVAKERLNCLTVFSNPIKNSNVAVAKNSPDAAKANPFEIHFQGELFGFIARFAGTFFYSIVIIATFAFLSLPSVGKTIFAVFSASAFRTIHGDDSC